MALFNSETNLNFGTPLLQKDPVGDVEVDGELLGAGVAVLCTAVKMWTMDGEEVH